MLSYVRHIARESVIFGIPQTAQIYNLGAEDRPQCIEMNVVLINLS